jgi:hypothetical protein
VKTHPHLLVRDRLAELFVCATRAEADADSTLEELAHWAKGEPPGPGLGALRAADGEPLFAEGGALSERFAPFADWVRDRARRFEAARAWIRDEGGEGDALECARAAWDAGLFFEVHELLEPAWLAEQGPGRDTLQGLIMAGAALHHLCEGNRAGAEGLLRQAAERLRDPPDRLGLELEPFAAGLAALEAGVRAGHVREIADVRELPRLERAAPERRLE